MQSADPPHNNKEKGVMNSFMSNIAQWVPYFSDSLFNPYFSKRIAASSSLIPVLAFVLYFYSNSLRLILWSFMSLNFSASWIAWLKDCSFFSIPALTFWALVLMVYWNSVNRCLSASSSMFCLVSTKAVISCELVLLIKFKW